MAGFFREGGRPGVRLEYCHLGDACWEFPNCPVDFADFVHRFFWGKGSTLQSEPTRKADATLSFLPGNPKGESD